jgi:phosphate transport system permease protein
VTVRIVDALVGDHEFNSPDTLSAFALGLVLFVVTLVLNVISVALIRKFKEKYKINTL